MDGRGFREENLPPRQELARALLNWMLRAWETPSPILILTYHPVASHQPDQQWSGYFWRGAHQLFPNALLPLRIAAPPGTRLVHCQHPNGDLSILLHLPA